MGSAEQHSLFDTRKDRARHIRRLYAVSVFLAICFVWAFRLSHIPANGEAGQWAWLGLFLAELWSGIYWLFYQALRWNMLFRTTFPDKLSQRYESRLPGVDIFVFTADAVVEPPLMVINTVLSVMAYDYPAEKLSVYLSDDGCSDITFYALLEASSFAKHWVPFCKRFKLEPRSPAAFFNNTHASSKSQDHNYVKHFATIRKLYEEMKRRVEDATKWGVPSEARSKHNGFSQWENSYTSRRDHDTILQIVVHKNDLHGSKDEDGCILPTLVYMAREKRPQYHSHYKAGAINSLVDLPGTDGFGGPIFIGTCCFFRRDALCWNKFSREYKNDWNDENENEKEVTEVNLHELVENSKALADCAFEKNTFWGKKIGSIYGSLVEDVVTGLWIQSQGWKSVYYNPSIRAFSGIAPTNLLRSLVQMRRWAEGQLQILFSEFRPKCYGHNKVKLGLQWGYLHYNTFAITSLSVLYYSIIPPLYLLKGISFFPKMGSLWFIPFASVIVGEIAYSLIEGLSKEGSIKGFFGHSNSSFLLTPKVTEDDLAKRYEKEIMEFGTSSPYFTVLATVALLNLFCLLSTLKDLFLEKGAFVEKMALQVLLCGFLVFINFPLYEAILIRKDKGRMPTILSVKSTTLAFTAYHVINLGLASPSKITVMSISHGGFLTTQLIRQLRVSSAISNGKIILILDCDIRDALYWNKLCREYKNDWNDEDENEKEVTEVNLHELAENSKALAECTYKKNTLWGKKIGSIYGCLVEDIVTGLWIQSQGWKSVYYNPSIRAFSGIAPTNLLHTLVQLRRWGEGLLQILFSEFRPKCYGHNKINLGLELGYLYDLCFAITSFSVLYYSIIPPLYLLKGISFFPKMGSLWFIPFLCVIVGEIVYSLIEGLSKGGSIKGLFGRSNPSFLLTPKVTEDDAAQRYEKEIMEFGTSSPYFTVLATIALLNLFCLLSTLKDLVLAKSAFAGEKMVLQVLLCGFLVFIYFPIYEAIFNRKDKGRMPTFISVKSTIIAFTACVFFKLFN
ncbi:hypothetical protein V8G54_036134 [Vigna mungo]|uniref:Cellulose synthase-like protein E1 n=1 Tax=Vigna mungo TaxID=3915 RepID=A0AAQ3MGS4_VIGMU